MRLQDDVDTTVTVLETRVGHLDGDLGRVYVYLEAPGTSPTFATLGYKELEPVVEYRAGGCQLILTAGYREAPHK